MSVKFTIENASKNLHVKIAIRFEEEARCTWKRKGLCFGFRVEEKPNKPFVLVRIIKRRQWRHSGS